MKWRKMRIVAYKTTKITIICKYVMQNLQNDGTMDDVL